MENEILQQILSKLTSMESDIKDLKQGQTSLENEVKDIKQKVSHIEVIIESEVKRDIRIVAENHLSLNQKLDELKDVNEKVLQLQSDTDALKNIAKNTFFDLEVLKAAK